MDGGWTQVRYGKRRRRFAPRDRDGQFDGGFQGRMDRAFPTFSGRRGWVPNPPPNQPVPPPGGPRYFGPRSSSFASVVRGRRYDPRPAPRFAFPGGRQPEEVRRQPADPQFGRLVRKLHMLIKMAHHLQNVSPEQGNDGPWMISRMVEILYTMVKPASPTDQTLDLIKGNADNWGYNTVTILIDHYKTGIDTALKELLAFMIPDWKSAFQVAVRWARRNIPRVSQGVIDHVEALIVAQVTSGGQQQPVGQPVPQGTMTAAAVEAPQQPQSADPIQSHTCNCAVKTAMQPVATMTDPGTREVHRQVPQAESPLEQREEHRRRRTRGVILTEDIGLQVEEEDIGGEDWRVVEATTQDSTHLELAAMFDALDAEQEREDLENQVSPVLSTPKRPDQTMVEVHSPMNQGEEDLFEDSADHFTSPEPSRFQVRRHVNTQRKLTDWDLVVTKKWLLIGDSNLSRIPDFFYKDLQVESYPGGHFRHAQALMEKTWPPKDLIVERIILSFGMNSRSNKSKETTVKNLQGAIRSTRRKFPYAEIWVPLVNFSSQLPDEEKENLRTLNDHVERNMGFIPLLPESRFQVEADDVHWTEDTGRSMLDHWMHFLNSTAL